MYYIFNKDGKNIGQCDFEPNAEDLASRQESYQLYKNPLQQGDEIWLVDGKITIISPAQLTTEELKVQHQSQIWEAIKQKRHTITRGGVYVKSVKKWFHTDDSSRTQYLALQILPQLPPDLMWKTMDNSFVKLDKALLTELAMTILTAEQADFANAEKHRLAMLQAQNPLEYDYSKGWTAIYDPTDKQGASDE
ncbi:DUF4376 domain-containing protein [Moraxella nasicaprae]|uniref:DUF4376 domain-containing protein n=1 Tax=Moraxella nasicaprae TaxID=2904122 RepID=A0ABY6F4F0_9GAMM|nr:DUF4376 domain-containing protein [Moraxella nasicaprae]UXZ04862.1 DUF4376 domain-containing protein [Moraxella nasicaprae]